MGREWGGRVEREEGGRRRGTWAGAAGHRRGWGQGWGCRRRHRRDGSIGRRGGLLGASVGRGEADGHVLRGLAAVIVLHPVPGLR